MEKQCLLVAVNAKYIHTNLAIRYIKGFCAAKYSNIELKEFSINDSIGSILKEIYSSDRDIYAFSCYIWNIDLIHKLCSSLKKLNPKAAIILGGPEVSFDAELLMEQYSYIDYIIRGEGEETFSELLELFNEKTIIEADNIYGLTYRHYGAPVSNQDRPLLQALDSIPFPYEDLDILNNKIIYYETSRGCPFNCQYCLSSTLNGVRYFSMDRIKQDIKLFVDKGIRQVKLVDRTFNCNKQHSLEIIKYIIELNGRTNFHFEIAADLIDDEMLNVLSRAPKDMFQFEIGVQSTNTRALKEVSRAMKLDMVKQNVLALQKAQNSHLHLDLIAGLPYEDFHSFGKSFDEIHELMPDMLQLGFLKLLKGSGIRERAEEYGIEYNSFNPYEVLKTKWISFEELTALREIEQLLELYYNSGRFKNSLSYIFDKHYSSYFSFYTELKDFWVQKRLFEASQGTRELYNILYSFAEYKDIMNISLNELMKLDWLMYYNNGAIPSSFTRYDHSKLKNIIHEYIRTNELLLGSHFPKEALDNKNLLKHINYEVFSTNVMEQPDFQQAYIVFFVKAADRKVHTFSMPLSEIQ